LNAPEQPDHMEELRNIVIEAAKKIKKHYLSNETWGRITQKEKTLVLEIPLLIIVRLTLLILLLMLPILILRIIKLLLVLILPALPEILLLM
jgi:hypothetical protein